MTDAPRPPLVEETGSITVLHVDDDPEFAAVVADFLERDHPAVSVESVTDVETAVSRLDEGVDCVVSDYDMPGIDGISFLERVREDFPELPFILFTGKGSEAVASDAISAGVTDYLQKRVGSEQYELLRNRIFDAVARTRSAVSYHEVFEKADIGLTIRDSETGELLDANQRYCEMLGYSHEEVLELDFDELTADVEGYDAERAREQLQACLEAGSGSFEWPDETSEGNLLWVHVGVRVAELGGQEVILGSVRDITERKERERALETEHERFLTLFENLPTPVVYGAVDRDERRIRAVNPAFEEVFGLAPGEAQGEELYDYILPPDEDLPIDLVDRVYDEGRITTEVRRQTVDGVRDFRLDVALREREDGPHEGYAVYTDVTEQKERERALERKNEQLDEFASVVGHDLTSPLATVSGRLELAAEECDSTHLASAQVTLDRMEDIVEDTLELAREGAAVGEVEPVDLGRLAERCWGTISAIEAGLEVTADATIEADPDRLRHLVENLLANAVRHGGPDVAIELGDLPDGDGFYVADDGPGIPEDARAEIFEPGVSGAEDGTGFGLAIVRRIAEAHGWTIEVAESQAGGARFEVRGVERGSPADGSAEDA